jgi:hypothetical protein
VTYTNEANSQFALEAMMHQSLDHNEILNVRWATVDPNPMAQKREAQRVEEQAAEAVRRALPASFVAELEGRDPEARKRKKIEGSFGLQGYEPPDEVWYARTRELEGAGESQALEAPDQQQLLEAPPSSVEKQPVDTGGGLLSGRTIESLKRLNGAGLTTSVPAAKPAGPLVAYGSDEESE